MHSIKAETLSVVEQDELAMAQVDVTGCVAAEVLFNEVNKVIHVNVNGICVLRICRAQHMELNHIRRSQT